MKRNCGSTYLVFIFSIIASLMLLSCAGEKKVQSYVSFYTGSVTLQRGNSAPVQVQIKEAVQDGDIFRTGEKSCLILQSSDGLVIRFESDTEAVISSLQVIAKREIDLNKGKVLSSVEKLKKGDSYSVKTSTVVASVRGTEFLTEYGDKGVIIAVGKGVVSVKNTSGAGEEKLIDKGKSAVEAPGTETIEIRDVNKVEILELTKLEKTPVVQELDKKTPDELKEIFRETEKSDEEINEAIRAEAGLSYEEMKAKYGRVDIITLYSGRVIQGIILSRGVTYKILTNKGPIAVNAKDVKRTDSK